MIGSLHAGVRDVTAEEVAFYREHGWVKLDGLIAPELAAEILERLQRKMGIRAHAEQHMGTFAALLPGPEWDNPSAEDERLREISHSAGFGRAGSALAGGRPMRFWIDSGIAKLPVADGGKRTGWHQDYGLRPIDRSGQLNIWIALVDMPPEQGAMRFLSGSQRAGVLGRRTTPEPDVLQMFPEALAPYPISPPLHLAPGDATVHDGLTLHSAPANETDATRWSYVVSVFPADALYTGMPYGDVDALGLEINQPFDHPRFPVLPTD